MLTAPLVDVMAVSVVAVVACVDDDMEAVVVCCVDSVLVVGDSDVKTELEAMTAVVVSNCVLVGDVNGSDTDAGSDVAGTFVEVVTDVTGSDTDAGSDVAGTFVDVVTDVTGSDAGVTTDVTVTDVDNNDPDVVETTDVTGSDVVETTDVTGSDDVVLEDASGPVDKGPVRVELVAGRSDVDESGIAVGELNVVLSEKIDGVVTIVPFSTTVGLLLVSKLEDVGEELDDADVANGDIDWFDDVAFGNGDVE